MASWLVTRCLRKGVKFRARSVSVVMFSLRSLFIPHANHLAPQIRAVAGWPRQALAPLIAVSAVARKPGAGLRDEPAAVGFCDEPTLVLERLDPAGDLLSTAPVAVVRGL